MIFAGALGDTVAGDGSYFISWEDLRVDQPMAGLNSRDEPRRVNRTTGRVIVVDKSGKGDSATVQGAIDMVPQNNTERVKILILPGIYRSGGALSNQ